MEPQMVHCGVIFTAQDDSGGAQIMGSREALAGALTNLLANAMQACSVGGRVSLVAKRDDGWLVFSVVDTGKGIPKALQDRLFEPFFTTRTEGTGLGLAIVREVLQMHGGEVAVQSREGEGSEFCLKLPLCP
jgi:two-component system sensor histidine kinase FlrB